MTDDDRDRPPESSGDRPTASGGARGREGWTEVTADRASGSERRFRHDVGPGFVVDLLVTEDERDEWPYHLVLSTRVERDVAHVSDHPVAAYRTREDARAAVDALAGAVEDVVADRDDLPDASDRVAYLAIPAFLDAHVEAGEGCRALYDEEHNR